MTTHHCGYIHPHTYADVYTHQIYIEQGSKCVCICVCMCIHEYQKYAHTHTYIHRFVCIPRRFWRRDYIMHTITHTLMIFNSTHMQNLLVASHPTYHKKIKLKCAVRQYPKTHAPCTKTCWITCSPFFRVCVCARKSNNRLGPPNTVSYMQVNRLLHDFRSAVLPGPPMRTQPFPAARKASISSL